MSSTPKCPKCGQWLPPASPEGLCPSCLLERASETITAISPASAVPANATVSRLRYFGDYELIDEIARGGMGVVYKAKQVSLNRPVAVKMILAGQFADEAAIERFYTEAEAAANLQHPNIVAIHEVGEYQGQHYFSMDYVEGKSLAQLLLDGPMYPNRAATYIKTIAEAIHFAHQRGTFHRDLKPSNILIDEFDHPRITDFGLAKLAQGNSQLSLTGTVMGTVSYMPPEQAKGKHDEIGPTSDVYSLGAILYELLTGRPPFFGGNMHDTLLQVIQSEPPPPRKLKPGLPADLETICLKCLEKNPLRRYPSARALAEDVGRFLNHAPIMARPVSRLRRMEHWSRQHPWTIAGVASALVLLLLGVTYGLWTQTRYMQYAALHPEYVRKSGPLLSQLRVTRSASDMLAVGLIGLLMTYRQRSAGLPLRELFSRRYGSLPKHPVSPGLVKACAILGVVGIFVGLHVTTKAIEVWVWEGSYQFLGSACITLWAGSALVSSAVREYRISHYGREETSTPGNLRDYQPRTVDFKRFAAVFAGECVVLAICYFFLPLATRNGLAFFFASGWSLALPMLPIRTKGNMRLIRMMAMILWPIGTAVSAFYFKGVYPGLPFYPAFLVGLCAAVLLCALPLRKAPKSQPAVAAN